MDEPKPLDSLFKEKRFRIPDYLRGYAWGREQLDAFWEDLVNLPDGRSYYTGLLTLKEIPASEVGEDTKEFWLVDDYSYKLYHIVDGQQRPTTFTLFLQAFIELLKNRFIYFTFLLDEPFTPPCCSPRQGNRGTRSPEAPLGVHP